ncbi:DUF3426 domain-containing protein [Achromobacter sp. Root565]|uniref:DUF3426 domain-containing protein n=1 Tax=Achromobacter sp. Root565 TaxID=1736564 RepID=UPI0006FD0DF7|nr:DUF3426 domain-containing protein [Achromobacter sp. Root565]KRA02939.1 hypothetical protein ASD71_13420 [Achromobacter sp. Root565]
MALTTRCPQCGTSFKVVPDQLRVRNGLVRCGACSTVFDGRACLVSAPGAPVAAAVPATAPLPSSAAAIAAPVLSAPEPHPPAAPIPEPAFTPVPAAPAAPVEPRVVLPWEDEPVAPPAATTPPIPPAVLRGRDDIRKRAEPETAVPDDHAEYDHAEDIDADDDGEPFLREPEPPRAVPARPAPAFRNEPIIASRSDEPALDWGAGSSRNDMRSDARIDPRNTPRHDVDDDFHDDLRDDVRDIERDDEYEDEDDLERGAHEPVLGDTRTRYSSATDVGRAPPEFLDQDRIERSGFLRKLWGYACLAGLIVLALQLLYAYRTEIANSVPALRPVLEAACRPLDCTVGYARRRDLISISSSSLQPPAGAAAIDDGRTRLVLTVMLHNRYDKPQHWPALVLELNDLSDTVVVRKVLMPENYLTPEQLRGPFGPQGALKISVPIEVTGVQVNGYQLDKFFP